MDNPRRTGLLLLLSSSLVFIGINNDMLPAETFPFGLLLTPLGLVLFVRGNREKQETTARRVERIKNPTIRSVTADDHADRQARSLRARGDVDAQLRGRATQGTGIGALEVTRDEVDFTQEEEPAPPVPQRASPEADDDNFEVSTDVSFPVDIQRDEKLADEIRKLQQLREDGIIDDWEFSAAKAKLLG